MKSLSAFLLLILLSLACGGNSSSTLEMNDKPLNYKGKTEKAQLDSNSNLKFLDSFFGKLQSPHHAYSTNLNHLESRGLRFFLHETQKMITKLSYEAIENDSFFSPSLSGLFGGKVSYQGEWDENSGKLLLNFDEFSAEGDLAWTGNVLVQFSGRSQQSSSFNSFSIKFDEFSFKDKQLPFFISGDMTQSYFPSSGNYDLVWNCHISQDSIELKLENYREFGYKSSLSLLKAEFEGDLYHNQFGQVHIKTHEKVEFQGQLPSLGGPIIISGTQGSNLKITPEGFGLVHYELDQDGDGVYELLQSQSHYQIEIY